MSFEDSGPLPKGADPLDLIARDHLMHSRLCSLLEEIADSLPDRVTTDMAQSAADAMKVNVAIHILDEELGLFPLLRAASSPDDNIGVVLSLLTREHEADIDFARELIEALEELALTGRPHNADMLGYMLRGYFELQRRHQAWEDAIVMPTARQMLAEDAINKLGAAMRRHRNEHPDTRWEIVFRNENPD